MKTVSAIEGQFAARFVCPKCQHRGAATDRINTTGSGLSRFFDVQNRRFLAVSCTQCGYTELYNLNVIDGRGLAADILDLLFGR